MRRIGDFPAGHPLIGLLLSLLLLEAASPAVAMEPIVERMAPSRLHRTGICADLESGLTNLADLALRNGLKIDAPDPDDPKRRTPLLCAIAAGRADSVEFLLKKGAKADVGQNGVFGPAIPLLAAAENGHGEIVKLLLAAKASVDRRGGEGWTALMWAAYENYKPNSDGYAVALEALLAAGADPNARNDRGETPLSLAIGNRNTAGVVTLASRGADPNGRDGAGRTFLSLAADRGDLEMVEALLRGGAKVDEADRDGKTAWVRAAEKAHRPIMERLAKAGARERYETLDPAEAFRNAAYEGDVPLMKRLLGKETGDVARGKRFGTAIGRAAKTAKIDAVRFLLESGADPNVVDGTGSTPLLEALSDYSSTGRDAAVRAEIASLLVGRGADVNAAGSRGETPLLLAATWDNPAAVRLLLGRKADPNRPDDRGDLPLAAAVRKGNLGMAKVLLDAKADPNAKDKQGKTAWVRASEKKDLALSSLLEKYGARPDYAAMSWDGNESSIESLLQKAVTTPAEWTDLWRLAFGKEAPPMDFGKYFVACAFLGHHAGWWYGIGFNEPVVDGKNLVVIYELVMIRVSSTPEAFRDPGSRGQYAMKVFPKRPGLDIVVRGISREQHVPGLDDGWRIERKPK